MYCIMNTHTYKYYTDSLFNIFHDTCKPLPRSNNDQCCHTLADMCQLTQANFKCITLYHVNIYILNFSIQHATPRCDDAPWSYAWSCTSSNTIPDAFSTPSTSTSTASANSTAANRVQPTRSYPSDYSPYGMYLNCKNLILFIHWKVLII